MKYTIERREKQSDTTWGVAASDWTCRRLATIRVQQLNELHGWQKYRVRPA